MRYETRYIIAIQYEFNIRKLCLQLMKNKDNALDNVASIINSFHPWRREKIFDDWIALYSQRICQPTEFIANWFSGNRIIAAGKLFRNLIMG